MYAIAIFPTMSSRKRNVSTCRSFKTKSGCRKWWQKVKTLTRLTSSNPPVPDLEDDDTIASSVYEKAELLAHFFALQCSGPDALFDSATGAPYPLPSSDSQPNFELSPISEETVLKHLLNLSPAKSTGCSLLTNRVLRETAPFIFCSLTGLHLQSLTSIVSLSRRLEICRCCSAL